MDNLLGFLYVLWFNFALRLISISFVPYSLSLHYLISYPDLTLFYAEK